MLTDDNTPTPREESLEHRLCEGINVEEGKGKEVTLTHHKFQHLLRIA